MKKHGSQNALRNSSDRSIVLHSEVRVRVTPRGGRDAVMGVRAEDGVILLRVAAPPVGGAANRACATLLADILGVKKTRVQLIGGETSRDKRFLISDMPPSERDTRLALLPQMGDDSL